LHCYPCAEQGANQPAVALCRSCHAGLCLKHLRETAEKFAGDAHLASGSMSAACHHDTWAPTKTVPTGAAER
jgi:hypothetical protein